MKTLYTSYYARSGKNPAAISISVKPPRWYPRMAHNVDLAPTWELVDAYKKGDIDANQYTVRYLELLEERGKTAQEIVDSLPEGAVLLCYEKPSDFCHRHVAAQWLREGSDVQITELPKP